jgi:GT2 family glycosyltransferase
MSTRSVPLSVVVCTRDRGDDLSRCLASLAALDPAPFEVVIIDQSAQPLDVSALLPGARHLRSDESGLSRARNRGLAAERAPIVAFLDDDCTVSPSWAADVGAAFERHPHAGVVFGSVVSASTDADDYVPVYAVARERRLIGRTAAARAHGIGAAMYLRSAAADAIGPFDECLGAGGEFRSSEDWDYTFRALACGIEVIETPAVVVRHFGGRRYSDGAAAAMLRWNAFSHGAVHAKFVRALDPIAAVLIAAELAALVALLRPLRALSGRPTNAARLAMYLKGLAAGLRAPMRRSERLFGRAAAEA